MNRSGRSWPWWRWVMMGLILLALALSGYLGWHFLVGGSVIGCDGGSACDHVLNGRWSTVGGVVPVSGLAAGAYLAMLLASFFLGPATAAPIRRLAWRAMLILVGAAGGSAVWFIIVQKWVIGSFCPYCMATHITGLLLAALVIWRAPGQFGDIATDAGLTNSVTASNGRWSVIAPWPVIGLAMAVLVAVCQIAFPPPSAYRGGQLQNDPTSLDPHAVPLIGSPDAPYVVTLLFDYECPHCQQLHLLLDETVRRYGGKVAFALCLTSLNSHCNPYITRDAEEFADSCELTKIGLAVWAAKRGAFPIFERWMFSFESGDRWHPRSPDAARAKAIELVGPAKFDAARTDPWIDQYMQTCVRIFGVTMQGGNGGVPKLVFHSHWVVPEPNDADDLILILHDSLGVPMP